MPVTEVRISPSRSRIAWCDRTLFETGWLTPTFETLTDDEVKDWTPLVPVARTDYRIEYKNPDYGWMPLTVWSSMSSERAREWLRSYDRLDPGTFRLARRHVTEPVEVEAK